MVAISIMGILTGIVVTSLSSSRGKARDAKKIADIGNIQFALELFYNRCGEYPASVMVDIDGNSDPQILDLEAVCAKDDTITFANFMTKIPTPLGPGPENYDYVRSDNRRDYVLHAQLEYPSDAIKERLDTIPSAGFNDESALSAFGTFDCIDGVDGDGNEIINYCISSK